MSAGFRKSLFGFNADDVMQYIERTHKEFVEKETEQKEKIEDLSSALDEAKEQIDSVLKEKKQMEDQLTVYIDRYDEIDRLSQNIGKLYIVAESNANAVMETAKNNKLIADDEIFKNIACMDNAQASLSELKEEMLKAANEFTQKLQGLMISLDKAKELINKNNEIADLKLEEYHEILSSINS